MKQILALFLVGMLLLTGCGTAAAGSTGSNAATATQATATETATAADTTPVTEQPTAATTDDAATLSDPADAAKEATGAFSIVTEDGAFSEKGSVYTITKGGEYTVSGVLEDGQIVVNVASDEEVKLILNNASISCSTDAPIVAVSGAELTVKSETDTYNTVTDLRTGASDDAEYDAAIYAACDLKLSGKGTLIITTAFDNGVKSKDDLTVKNVTLKVTSTGVALKGNDSVTIESGSLILTSTASDAIKTENSDVSSKGKQRGTIAILGGQVDIYAACDGLSAAYNVEISEESDCVVNVYTASYASGPVATLSEQYLIVPISLYSNSSDYYAYFYNDDDTAGVWVQCVYESMVYSGGRASYYALLFRVPSGYENILFHAVASGTTPDGSNFTAASTGDTINRAMTGYLIKGVSDTVISGDWVQISSSGDGKTTYSSKGIKASNEILISGGAVTVYAADDGMHANGDIALDSGSVGTGNIRISGGSVTVTSADDGIHADGALTIDGGTVNVAEAHEGMEANVITLNAGTVFVYGKDDGINGCAGSATPLVQINGGYLQVQTPSGDTDAIDVNGSFVMTGGTVLVLAGSQMGGVAGSVDVDGTISVTGGTIIAFGGICVIPSSGSVNVYTANGTTFQAGSYALLDSDGGTIFSFTLDSAYTSCWIASESFVLNGSYRLEKDGASVLNWTQSSASEGNYSNSGSGGRGGFGGSGGW
ncbi:MAG: carbohydrate-binding domain-containing protein [Clostridia bacterium]|nr:carbohydrate-binding domain-containing protein [Clostridia bacterium]